MKKRPYLPVKARKLISELISAVDMELFAAGPDEVKQHPTLKSKYRLCERARRYLNEMEKK